MKESDCLEGTTTQEIAGFNVKLSYSCCNSDLCNSFDAAKKAAEQQAVATTTPQPANPTESVSTAKTTTPNHAASDRSSFVFICFVSSFFLYFLI